MTSVITLSSSATSYYGENTFYYPIRLSGILGSSIQLLGGVSFGLRSSALMYLHGLELDFEITPLWDTSPSPISSRNLSIIIFGY